MSSTFEMLIGKGLIPDYPSHMKNNVQYEVMMGSTAYGVSDNMSDIDIYGFSMPPKTILFPYHYGYLYGFGNSPEAFNQFQKHHIMDTGTGSEYDMSIYNIVKFFHLCMENNPNMVDALFVPTRCVLHSTAIGNHVRDNRHMFLSKRVWHKFKGYAFSQLNKMRNKHALEFVNMCRKYDLGMYADLKTLLHGIPKDDPDYDNVIGKMCSLVGKIEQDGKRSKRLDTIWKHGYDTKFGYHVVRLLDECEQILESGDLDLTRAREQMKAVRRGDWSIDKITDFFDVRMKSLEEIYGQTTAVPYEPPVEHIKTLLMECIEMHYGSIDKFVKSDDRLAQYLLDAQKSIDKALKHV